MAPFCLRTICTCTARRDMQIRFFFNTNYSEVPVSKCWGLLSSNFDLFIFYQLKTKIQIRGTIVFQQFRAHVFIKPLCLLLFRFNIYLSMYQFKIRSMTLKIWSCRRFKFGFTFCTCITLCSAVTNLFLL